MFEKKENKLESSEEKIQENLKDSEQIVDQEKVSENDRAIEISESEYHKLATEVADYKDKYIRLRAEFDNARKRMERERIDFIRYANEGIMVEFLNILDDLERSVEAAKQNHQDYSAFLKGIELVMAHVYEMLKKNDVKPMESVGKKFDPHMHEPLMQVEIADSDDDVVVEEFQKGYYLGERVIRTAKVKVNKKK